MIRRKKTTIFTDAKDTTTVLELKKMIEGILKIAPRDQRLLSKDNQTMEDDKMLQDYGITMMTARAQSPIQIGLAVRVDGEFEPLELTPYSSPPDLPDVMKNQEAANGTEQVA
uniref:Elongin-B n=1 Tax=Culicoides sonorensis TaxID=179676 RepID=A0A336MEB3_CULSO